MLPAKARWIGGLWATTSLFFLCDQIYMHPGLPYRTLAWQTLLAPVWLLLTPLLLGIIFEEWEPACFLYGGIALALVAWRMGRAVAGGKNQLRNAP
jgi:hypothetical protein